MMRDIVVSTIAFFVAAWFVKRRLVDMDIPAGMVRNLVVFAVATAISYGVMAAVDWLVT